MTSYFDLNHNSIQLISQGTLGQYRQSNQMNSVSEDQIFEESGFRLKLGSNINVNDLTCRNFPQYSQDSIGLEEVTDKPSYFDPFTLSHFRIPENTDKFRCSNLPGLQNFSQNDYSGQIKVQKEQKTQSLEGLQKEQVEKLELKTMQEIQFEIDIVVQTLEESNHSKQAQPQKTEKNEKEQSINEPNPQKIKLDLLKQDFKKLSLSPPVMTKDLKQLSKKHKVQSNTVIKLFKQWNFQTESLQKSPDTSISKRESNKVIKYIYDNIQNNPFISVQQLSLKLSQKSKTKYKIHKAEVLDIIQSIGYVKLKENNNRNQQQLKDILEQRYIFAERYKQLKNQDCIFYYFGQFLFHPYLDKHSFWGKKDQNSPKYTKKFISNSIILVGLLSFNGSFLWQIRDKDYQPQEYSQLLAQLFVKFKKRKQGKVVVVTQSPLRQYETIKAQVDKANGITVPAPAQSPDHSPIEQLFQHLRKQVNQYIHLSKAQLMKQITNIVMNLKSSFLTELINKSKMAIQKSVEDNKDQ